MHVRLQIAVVSLFAVVALPAAVQSAETAKAKMRTWTDSTGSFKVEAELVELVDGKVRLERADGQIITVSLDRLSDADQKHLRTTTAADSATVSQLTGEPQELQRDDGKPGGKKSFPMGHAVGFDAPGEAFYLTSVKIHGSRYGQTRAPKENFFVSLCDEQFNLIADFPFPYNKFQWGNAKWITLRVKPTKVPAKFVICVNFNPTATKGVYVSHDAEGKSLVGVPGRKAGSFSGGDWLVHVTVDQLKSSAAR